MNARSISISLSLAVAMIAASADVLSQGRSGGAGGGMGGAMGGGMGGSQAGGMPSGMQRGTESVPVERPGNAQDRGRSASVERQAPEQAKGKTPQDLLQQNTRLSDNVAKLFPAGTNLQAAATGFRNLGEFVAAAHVSSNLGIPFADLKTRLLAGDSLGAAIQALKPGADAQLEANRARARADAQLRRG
jgi:hypothetical protein